MSTEGSGENVLPPLSMPGEPEQTYLFPKAKGHARSISHGGTPTLVPNPIGRPSALKSANRGHQRAFSQGQIGDSGPQSGHSRTGSRTDFILPPGHRDTPTLPAGVPRASVRGHSRQASRSESIYTIRRNSEASPWLRAMFWMMRRKPPAADTNHIVVIPNHMIPAKTPRKEHPNGHRCDNKVRTTKYTLLSFLPKNLLEQFHRIANLYFIFIVLLNWFPSINAFGKEVAMLPVLFVLGVTAIKDLFEDRRRHQSDKRINNSYCRVYKKAVDRYMRVRWAEVRAGDLVHLSNNEAVPADLVLLRSSDSGGVAYLDTGNLDGETNLKPRHVATGFREKHLTFSAGKFISRVEVDQPSTKIYRFHGTIVHPNEVRVPLTSENLLLRDCFVKNTDYVEGIVVYAGHETKAMLNNGGPRYKRSALERSMNTDIIWCVLVLLLLCCIGAVGSKLWLERYYVRLQPDQTEHFNLPPFIPHSYSPSVEGLLSFWTYIIILQVMIPISLYVTIEMTKLLQVYHIHHNVDMYDPTTDTRVECRALNITEELGQVQYLFSDKTGTLTENKMVFRRCTIGGLDYDHPEDGSPAGRPERRDSWPGALTPVVTPITKVTPNQQLSELLKRGGRVREFLLVLAICNTVVVSYQPHVDGMNDSGIVREPHIDTIIANGAEPAAAPRSAEKYARLAESRSTTPSPPLPSPTRDGASRDRFPRLRVIPFIGRDRVSQLPDLSTPTKSMDDTPKVRYEAESPDELALTEAALAYGVELRRRGVDEVELAVLGERTVVSVLRVQTFDAARKCMSVAVRGPDGQVVLYVKGADSAVLGALAPVREGSVESAALSRTRSQLDAYARRGLRTLAVARRTLSARQWDEWCAEHARSSIVGPGRERRVRESLARLESGLSLLGGTGVEDRLQEDVPRTVHALLDAGIVIWVLTGDKPETAVNIAYSANLFSQQDELMHLMARSKDQAEATINCYLQSMENGGSRWDAAASSSLMDGGRRGRRARGRPSGRALVVDGKTLTYILDRRSGLVAPFLALTKRCSSVLCCRATPLQKAYIVKAVKEELGVSTLAIGDGANDVSMIQTADVGIGLSGQEGRQAVMSSDFALSRFKYLERLLLVHGHWSYDRLARMILYFFLKNATFVFIVFWFQFYCGFSASIMIDQVHLMLYNLVFTALPPIAIGAYDRLAPESLLLDRPGLYKGSRSGQAYRPYSYWLILLESLYISLVIFFFCVYAYWGLDIDIWQFGLVNTTSCLIVMTLYVAIETRSWRYYRKLTIIHLFALAGSVLAFFVITLAYQSMCVTCFGLPSTFWIMHRALFDPQYWLLILLTTTASLAPRLAWRAVANTLWPNALGRAVLQRRADKRRARLPYSAAYHNPTASTHIYRSTYENSLSKHQSETSAVT